MNMTTMQSSRLLGITYYSNFCFYRRCKGMDKILQSFCGFIIVACLTALGANLRRHIFDDYNTLANIGGKIGNSVLHGTFTHKTSYCLRNILFSHAMNISLIFTFCHKER